MTDMNVNAMRGVLSRALDAGDGEPDEDPSSAEIVSLTKVIAAAAILADNRRSHILRALRDLGAAASR